MDIAKILFFALIIGFAIVKELGSSAKKEKSAGARPSRPVPPVPSASAQIDVPVPRRPHRKPKPPKAPVMPPPPAPEFEEGQRVTADLPPMQPNTSSDDQKISVPDLSDPANLRAAIVFSEILNPKF